MSTDLTVYGHPASQPSRTVYWTCLLIGLEVQLGKQGRRGVLAMGDNPRGQVPSIDDNGFVLAEMAAIVGYLADKHGWLEGYPVDLQTRAKIHQFLHMHHHLVRLGTYHLMAPHVVRPLNLPPAGPNPLSFFQTRLIEQTFAEDDPLRSGGDVMKTIVGFLEDAYFTDESPYLCNTQQPTVADLACYAEVGQFRIAHLFDFSPYPRTTRWLDLMAEVPYHDTIHAYNFSLGDIANRPNTMDRFTAATQAGFQALLDTGRVVA
jgi:glutathione S-transferase